MKNEIVIEERAKLVLHAKALIKPELFRKGFHYLHSYYLPMLEIDNIDNIEIFNRIQSMLLTLQGVLIENEDYENLSIIKKIYKILYHQALEQTNNITEINSLYKSNEFYVQELQKKLK